MDGPCRSGALGRDGQAPSPIFPAQRVTVADRSGTSAPMIETQFDGAVAHLILNRGGARNALPVAAWQTLATAAQNLSTRDIKAVVLRSTEPAAFSAGADLAEFSRFLDDDAARRGFREAMRAAIDAVAALPVPTVAAIDGGCFGAAVALVLACDVRIAGDAAVFATTPAKLGLGYPRQDVDRLVRQVGRGQASRMLFTGESIDAGEALRIGLVETRAPDAAAAADGMARRVADNDADAVRLLKRTLVAPANAAHDADFDAAFGSDGFAQRLAAFHRRRRPGVA